MEGDRHYMFFGSISSIGLKKNICFLLGFVMVIIGISISYFNVDSLHNTTSSENTEYITHISRFFRNLGVFVEENDSVDDQFEQLNSISIIEVQSKKPSNRTLESRMFLLFVIFSMMAEKFRQETCEDCDCISNHIIQSIHEADGKKRIS